MSKTAKLLEKAKSTPAGLSFSEFKKLLNAHGFEFARQTGSNQIFKSEQHKAVLSVQRKGSKAKGYQVRQFPNIIGE